MNAEGNIRFAPLESGDAFTSRSPPTGVSTGMYFLEELSAKY